MAWLGVANDAAPRTTTSASDVANREDADCSIARVFMNAPDEASWMRFFIVYGA